MADSLNDLIVEIFEWQQRTFLESTREGRINHFLEEVGEYLKDTSNQEEAADVFMLFVAIFMNEGIDLHLATENKLQINRARTWYKAPGGYSKHVKEE